MRVLFAGTPAAAVPSLDALAAAHDVAAVLTRPDAAQGRSGALVPSPVKQRALELGLDVHTPRTLRDGAFLPVLADLTLDLACVVAYGNLIPQVLLDVVGWVNLHFSLLPAYRGAAPVQAAIAAGEEVTGASVFALEAGMDTGPVYGHLTEQIGPADTAGTLLERLSVAGAHLLADVTSGIGAGALVPVPQRGEPTYAPKVTPADAAVDWHLPSFAVDRRIRAYTPEPGPYATLGGVRVGLGPVTETDITLPPGRIEAGKREVLVGTGTRAVRLSTVHPAGKREMSAADWARGAHPESFDGGQRA